MAMNRPLPSPSPSPVLETPPDLPHLDENKLPGLDEALARVETGDTPGREKRSNSYPQRERHAPTTSTTNGQSSSTAHPIQKLSAAQIKELTAEPDSLPVRIASSTSQEGTMQSNELLLDQDAHEKALRSAPSRTSPELSQSNGKHANGTQNDDSAERAVRIKSGSMSLNMEDIRTPYRRFLDERKHRHAPYRDVVPSSTRRRASASVGRREPLKLRTDTTIDASPSRRDSNERTGIGRGGEGSMAGSMPSPASAAIPLPPFSLPTYLHLELSSDRPSPLYIQPAPSKYYQFESSKVKFDRLLNFLLLPPQLEQLLLFGALTCLDSWLYTFTILPLRFFRAIWILLSWACRSALHEVRALWPSVRSGISRFFSRSGERKDLSKGNLNSSALESPKGLGPRPPNGAASQSKSSRYRRTHREEAVPSPLQPNHKADILRSLLIIVSCSILMRFDASKMYHTIRGQATIKLYVIYNVLEVCDRLFSALGQDILECLFSSETLERKSNGRSKVARPFWMFLLALVYTVIHSTALFYQVITLNVAVNSYSNALLTLLMSNQFVEIKGTVFKKFEKENLFQLTCADIVERFQLWFMLLIIALRNVVELGGLSIAPTDFTVNSSSASFNSSSNAPWRSGTIIPSAFNVLPSLFPAHVFGPFLMVLGSEMLVDWLKHAYITKFNITSPRIYSRFFDVLAKDYYVNAFTEPNITRRLGLPVVPISCLFIRAMLQTYHMFLATNVSPPPPIASSAATSLAVEANATASPVIAQIDTIFRTALGRSSFGGGSSDSGFWSWTVDDVVALATMIVFFLALFLVLLAFKLALGMLLLSVARERFKGMKEREEQRILEPGGKRIGGWGVVEVSEDNRKWIYEGDADGLRAARERETRAKEKDASSSGSKGLESVERYSMVAKRIW